MCRRSLNLFILFLEGERIFDKALLGGFAGDIVEMVHIFFFSMMSENVLPWQMKKFIMAENEGAPDMALNA